MPGNVFANRMEAQEYLRKLGKHEKLYEIVIFKKGGKLFYTVVRKPKGVR